MAYNVLVTRTIVIIGLMLLAAFLPLAVVPVAIVVAGSLVFIARVAPVVRVDAQPVALRALTFFRAPPSSR